MMHECIVYTKIIIVQVLILGIQTVQSQKCEFPLKKPQKCLAIKPDHTVNHLNKNSKPQYRVVHIFSITSF